MSNFYRYQELVVPQGEAVSSVFDNKLQIIGGFITPTALETSTKIAFKVCMTEDGTFVPLYDQYNALIEVTVTLDASRAYILPLELARFPYWQIWCEASGVDVDQDTAARTFQVFGK
jgi:hypothetical protein